MNWTICAMKSRVLHGQVFCLENSAAGSMGQGEQQLIIELGEQEKRLPVLGSDALIPEQQVIALGFRSFRVRS